MHTYDKSSTLYLMDPREFRLHLEKEGKVELFSLDLGRAKIGVAKGNLRLGIATPLAVIPYSRIEELGYKLNELIISHQIGGLVVGLSDLDKADATVEFIMKLELGLPFVLEDELFTTKAANHLLSEIGLKRKKRNRIDDKIAAQLILQSFFDRIA